MTRYAGLLAGLDCDQTTATGAEQENRNSTPHALSKVVLR
jgi:hypothetical protein